MLKKSIITTVLLVSLGFMAFSVINDEAENNTVSTSVEAEEGTYEPIVVLELFTSQGCSSCPSADALLNKVKKQGKQNVFALSYHVDYWNYIGWEDPFSKSIYAKKQRAYNIKFKNRSNYTPQLVVNGKEHFVGSSSSKMSQNIAKYEQRKTSNKVTVDGVKSANGEVKFSYNIQGNLNDKLLRVVLVLDERTTQVKRGENRNRTITNSNIVVAEDFVTVTESKGATSIKIPSQVRTNEKIRLMVFVENDDYDITGATKSMVRI